MAIYIKEDKNINIQMLRTESPTPSLMQSNAMQLHPSPIQCQTSPTYRPPSPMQCDAMHQPPSPNAPSSSTCALPSPTCAPPSSTCAPVHRPPLMHCPTPMHRPTVTTQWNTIHRPSSPNAPPSSICAPPCSTCVPPCPTQCPRSPSHHPTTPMQCPSSPLISRQPSPAHCNHSPAVSDIQLLDFGFEQDDTVEENPAMYEELMNDSLLTSEDGRLVLQDNSADVEDIFQEIEESAGPKATARSTHLPPEQPTDTPPPKNIPDKCKVFDKQWEQKLANAIDKLEARAYE